MRVFVSHASEDQAWAEWVVAQLRSAGYDVEVDLDWGRGQNFLARMRRALETSDAIIALYSTDYFAKEHTMMELDGWIAGHGAVGLVPLRVADCAVPYLYAPYLWDDIYGLPNERALESLLRAVAAAVTSRAKVFLSYTPALSSWPSRRSFVQAARDAVRRARMVAVEPDTVVASGPDERLRRLMASTLYVGIIGFTAGAFIPNTTVSYEEFEFDRAAELGIPRLTLLLNQRRRPTAEARDGEVPTDGDRSEMERFRKKIQSAGGRVVFVDDPEDVERTLLQELRQLADARAAPMPAPTSGWVMAGQGAAAEARAHVDRRGRGQRSRVGDADLFRGRRAARAAVVGWLTAATPPGRLLVVTGQPGAGKSTVVARAVLDLEETYPQERGLAFHARDATALNLFAGIGELVGRPAPDSIASMIDVLRWAAPPILRVVVDALDEAATDADRNQLVEALTELARLPMARVVVATRPMAASNVFAPGTLFHRLGARSAANLLDLDQDEYFEREGLRDFAAALLRQDGVAVPTPPDGAWRVYRQDARLTERLADAVADRAGRNYLVAALTADQVSQADEIVNPDSPDFEMTDLAATIGEALTKYLDRQPVETRLRVHGLLTALAYARGGGVDDGLWLRFAERLDVAATALDLQALRTTAAADYLLQTSRQQGRPLTRLFHQALIDELLLSRDRKADEDRLLETLLPAPSSTWHDAGEYERTFGADHAAAAARLPELLSDPVYPAVTDLDRLLPFLPAEPPHAIAGVVDVLRTAARRARPVDPARRSRLFALTAAHLGHLDLTTRFGHAQDMRSPGPRALPVWAHSIGTPHQTLEGHAGPVLGLAFARAAERMILVSAGGDRTIRLWDPDTGREVEPTLPTDAIVRAVACGRIGEQDIAVGGDANGALRFWDLLTGQTLGDQTARHPRAVLALAFGRASVVSAGADGTLCRWDPLTAAPVGAPMSGHDGEARCLAVGHHDRRDIIVSGGYDGTVRVWDQQTGEAVIEPIASHQGAVCAVTIARVGNRDVVVSGGADGTIQLSDLTTGRPVAAPMIGHEGPVRALAVGRASGAPVIISAGDDATVRVWNPGDGPLGAPLAGHTGPVRTLAYTLVAGRSVIASAGEDGVVRLWDPYAGRVLRSAHSGHQAPVRAVATGRLVHNVNVTWDVAASAGEDGTVRMWDARTGQPVREPFRGHGGAVTAVAIDSLASHELVASGGEDGTIRVWNAQAGGATLIDANGGATVVAMVRDGNKRLVLSGGADGALRLWEPGRPRPLAKVLSGHAAAVLALTVGRLAGRDAAVSGDAGGAIRTWDLRRRRAHSVVPAGHAGAVLSVVLGTVGGREAVVSAGADGTVRIWDAHTGAELRPALTGHDGPVHGVAVGSVGGRDVVVSGGADCTLRLWDPHAGTATILDCYNPIRGIAMTADLVLFAAGRAVGSVSVS